MSDLPDEIRKVQHDLTDYLELNPQLVTYRHDEKHGGMDWDEYPSSDSMLTVSGWVISIEWRDLRSGDTWTTVLANEGSGQAQRVGLASLAIDRFS